MDLKDLHSLANARFEETQTISPIHPVTGKPMGFTVEIRSMRSEPMVRLMDKFSREAQLKAAKENRTGKVEVETIEQSIARDVDIAATLVVSFKGLKDKDKEIGNDAAAIRKVLSEHDWLRKQVIEEAGNEQNFFGKP